MNKPPHLIVHKPWCDYFSNEKKIERLKKANEVYDTLLEDGQISVEYYRESVRANIDLILTLTK